MSEPIFTKENHEGKVHFPLEFNTGFVYDKNDVHIGEFEDNISLDIKYAFKGDSRWMAYWCYPSYQQEIGYIYLCVRRTGTFNGQCSIYLASVYDGSSDPTLCGPLEDNLLGPNPQKYDFTITNAVGVWQIIKIDVRAWFVNVVHGIGSGAFPYINLDDMELRYNARKPLFVVMEPKGTAGNTWEIALVDSPAKFQMHGLEIFPASMLHLEHWCVSPDASQASWKIPVDSGDTYIALDEGGFLSCIQYVPYILLEPNGSGIRMRKRYEIAEKFISFVATHVSYYNLSDRSIAQSVTPSKDISMDTFSFVGTFTGSNNSIGTGWKLGVYLDNGGDPDQVSNKIGEMVYFDSMLLPLRGISIFIWTNITFMAPNLIQLTAGTKYWFVLEQVSAGNVFDVAPNLIYVKEPAYTDGQVYDYQESAGKIDTGLWGKFADRTYLFFIMSHKFADGPIPVEFPLFVTPDRVESWNRLSFLKDGSPKIYFQASNDNGLGYGVSPPDYNDSEWLEYTADLLKSIRTDQNGKDRLKLRVDLTAGSDKLKEMFIYYYLFGKEPTSEYTPVLITKQMVASKNPILDISDITDAAIQEGELHVIATLMSAPYGSRQSVDYQDMLVVQNAMHAKLFRDKLQIAMSYATLAYLNSLGIGNVGVGPVTSVSADGMSKSYGYSFGVLGYNKRDSVALSFAELCALNIKELLRMWFAFGYAKWKPAIARRNEFYESDYWHTAGDQRRKNVHDPVIPSTTAHGGDESGVIR